MLFTLTFQAFNAEFKILTDNVDIARLVPEFRFGVDFSTEKSDGASRQNRKCIALMKDMSCLDSLIDEMRDTQSIRFGDGVGDIMSFDAGTGNAAVSLPDLQSDAERVALTAVPVFVRLVLLSRNWYFMHAAAVCRDERAVLFLGENETGKSTLARKLVLKNWSLMSDDSLPVFVHHGPVCATPVREVVNVSKMKEAEILLMESAGFTSTSLNGFLLPPELGDIQVPVHAVFYTGWAENGLVTRVADKAFAFKKLLAASITPLSGPEIENYVRITDQLLNQCRHYCLEIDPQGDPEQVLEKVEQFLEEA